MKSSTAEHFFVPDRWGDLVLCKDKKNEYYDGIIDLIKVF